MKRPLTQAQLCRSHKSAQPEPVVGSNPASIDTDQVITGHEAEYFDYVYDQLSAEPTGVSAEARRRYVQAYSRPEALRTGLPPDVKHNQEQAVSAISTPVLYLRGERDNGDIERYLSGFRQVGLRAVRGELIEGSGHFAPDEQPQRVAAALRRFLQL